MRVKELSKKYKNYVRDMRREFHMNPEESLKEYRTSKRIKEELEKIGVQCEIVGETGVIGVIKGEREGKTIALRGDIDALSVQENSDKDYASKVPGMMHACGHDAHGAMLLGAAKVLNEMKSEIKGEVRLFFQPGEELVRGALKMIKDGALEGVDSIFGLHVSSEMPVGTICCDSGARCASGDIFIIKVLGSGGHGAKPQECVDTVVVTSAMVMNLQSIVSREIDPLEPALLTIGIIKSGTRHNVIASEGVLEGTIRCYNPEVRKHFFESIERVAKFTGETYRAKVQLEYITGVNSLVNDINCSNIATLTAGKIVGEKNIISKEPSMGGEDFSEFSSRVPGVMTNLGARNEKEGIIYPHHHEKFDIDEEVLEIGVSMYVQYALDYLNHCILK